MYVTGDIKIAEYDAVCSGYQHYRGLLKDANVGSGLGMFGSVSGDDVYTKVGKVFITMCDADPKVFKEKPKSLKRFSHFMSKYGVNLRTLIKRPTITLIYGATD